MANVVVVGAQWGDEGKGKIVDWLSLEADVVVRFQGGHNAGHTLVIDHEVYKLTLLPSGIVRPGKLSIIGNGVVLDPQHFLEEVAMLAARGVKVSPDNLKIAENATLILGLHRELDAHRESSKVEALKIGTTKRGIGPAYEDKVGRRAIRLMDLAEPDTLDQKIARLLAHHEPLAPGPWARTRHGARHPRRTRPRRRPNSALHGRDLGAPRNGAAGGQAHSLRRRAGRPARCRSWHLSFRDLIQYGRRAMPRRVRALARRRSAMCWGSPRPIRRGLAADRFRPSSTTASASGLATAGHEFGTVTGRRRRCGWFDAVLVRQTVKTSGIDGIALTKLDILDGFPEIKVCVGYTLDGQRIDRLPASQAAQARVTPVYETIEGWEGPTAGARSWAALPAQAIKYVRRIEELIEAPVALLSTSPERADTILVYDPFRD